VSERARRFAYAGLEVDGATLVGRYELDGRPFAERVELDVEVTSPAARAVAELWYLLAGLSYYKAGAARTIDLGATALGEAGHALLEGALLGGLGEFAWRNGLDLSDVEVVGGAEVTARDVGLDPDQVLVPFGGGIDSAATLLTLSPAVAADLFVVSPQSGRFAALEATLATTGRAVARATRALDPALYDPAAATFHGHVPVTAMVALLAATAAAARGRGGVVMSNEASASVANLVVEGRAVNHQWSKSLEAEDLIQRALDERVGGGLVVASALRDRSELWVAKVFAEDGRFLDVFRSCNRAFAQDPARRLDRWCGTCPKCLFVQLVLAPFVARERLEGAMGVAPLADPALAGELRTLVGLGESHKPFECVGDPDESAVALAAVARDPAWADVAHLADLARDVGPTPALAELLAPRGVTRVPAHWLR
jgi:hypothetical protein